MTISRAEVTTSVDWQRSSVALAGNGKNTLNLSGMLGCFEGGIAKEGMNRREAQVAAADADALVVLQVIKEGNDQRRVDFLKAQAGRRLMRPSLGELQHCRNVSR
ncbi:hypothetical protein ILFOPFJJ_06134 [Ensifer psoraleae]|uniref:hypothetical protein n=1 Tax=Sinorhizobium psoraleae TaxID=520838 RepID=UPI001FE7D546|nr:hypothetical protein [Sinorhizobium psoraleae]NRP75211.1 hypothetical protein [Sinorhizobium psoraleae]